MHIIVSKRALKILNIYTSESRVLSVIIDEERISILHEQDPRIMKQSWTYVKNCTLSLCILTENTEKIEMPLKVSQYQKLLIKKFNRHFTINNSIMAD